MPSSVVSTTTAVRLRELLRRGPLAAPPPVLGSEFGRTSLFVRCTSVTPAGTGVGAQCYPAVVVDLDSSQLVADQPELGNVWLTLINGGVVATPAVDNIYEVHMSGEFDPDPTGTSDPRPRVFAAAQAGVSAGEQTYTSANNLTTGANDTFLDTGLDLSLPSAGTYFVDAMFFLDGLTSSLSGLLIGRYYDETAAAAVTDSTVDILQTSTAGTSFRSYVHMRKLVTVTTASTIRVEIEKDTFNGAVWTAVVIVGRSILNYLKVS